jgi:hypothetical protein
MEGWRDGGMEGWRDGGMESRLMAFNLFSGIHHVIKRFPEKLGPSASSLLMFLNFRHIPFDSFVSEPDLWDLLSISDSSCSDLPWSLMPSRLAFGDKFRISMRNFILTNEIPCVLFFLLLYILSLFVPSRLPWSLIPLA